jgi:outer membrane protein OmpA-like peptidoglycan-associated protein
VWRGLTPEQAYYENMKLSQERTRAMLMYVFSIEKVRDTELLRWLLSRVTANGLSSSRRVTLPDGSEDPIGSQRVEFRVRTSAEDQLEKILKAIAQ